MGRPQPRRATWRSIMRPVILRGDRWMRATRSGCPLADQAWQRRSGCSDRRLPGRPWQYCCWAYTPTLAFGRRAVELTAAYDSVTIRQMTVCELFSPLGRAELCRASGLIDEPPGQYCLYGFEYILSSLAAFRPAAVATAMPLRKKDIPLAQSGWGGPCVRGVREQHPFPADSTQTRACALSSRDGHMIIHFGGAATCGRGCGGAGGRVPPQPAAV